MSQRAPYLGYELHSNSHRDDVPFLDIGNPSNSPNPDEHRIHVTSGEVNLLPTATFLKVGTTALIVGMIDAGWTPPVRLEPSAPRAIREVSADCSLGCELPFRTDDSASAIHMRAIDHQWLLLDEAKRWYASRPAGPFGDPRAVQQVLAVWGRVLGALDRDPLDAIGVVDWVSRKAFLERYQHRHGLDWCDPLIASRALRTQEVPLPNRKTWASQFLEWCEGHREVDGFVPDDDEVRRAIVEPPPTRASVRGATVRLMQKLEERSRCVSLATLTWTEATFRVAKQAVQVSLGDPVGSGLDEWVRADNEIETLDVFAGQLVRSALGEASPPENLSGIVALGRLLLEMSKVTGPSDGIRDALSALREQAIDLGLSPKAAGALFEVHMGGRGGEHSPSLDVAAGDAIGR